MRYALVFAVLFLLLLTADVLIDRTTTDEEAVLARKLLIAQHRPLPPYSFTHDGCTLFPDRLPGHDFTDACFRHDVAYWAGGSHLQRKYADRRFREDLKKSGFFGVPIAYAAYAGVRVFGNSPITHLLDAEWGYGWDD